MTDAPPLIALVDIHKAFLSRQVLRGVTFSVHEGDRLGLLGLNGAGKSTLMKIMAGLVPPDSGDVRPRRGMRIEYLDQSFHLDDGATVRGWVEKAFAHLHALEAERERIHRELAQHPDGEKTKGLLHEQAELTRALELAGAYDAEARLSAAMHNLGLPPGDRLIGTLSGGEKRRVALCRALLEKPDLLLLDEPTNHLDTETLEWLEDYLETYPGTVVLVTHDRYFLDHVANRMIEVENGCTKAYSGNYSDYLEAKDKEAGLAERTEMNRQRALQRELEWYRRQPKARTTKSKSRIRGIEQLVANRPREEAGSPNFLIPDGPRVGKTVIEVEHLFKSLGGRELIGGLTFTMIPGDRIGIVGRNGAGKTTLLRLLLGLDQPDRGKIRQGKNVAPVYGDQHRELLDSGKSVLEEVAGEVDWLRVNGERISVRAYLHKFLFRDETLAMPVGRLSGGERNRVMLAKLLREGGNLVALDEPTNDLDLQTLRVLEDALAVFEGCALIVSHDRYFLNRVATRILWLPGDGTTHEIVGNYDDFRLYRSKLEERRRQQKKESEAPRNSQGQTQKPKKPRDKLSYNEQREYEGMEERILEGEARLEEVEGLLAIPDTYMEKSKDEITVLRAEQDELREKLNALYDRWAELSERAR